MRIVKLIKDIFPLTIFILEIFISFLAINNKNYFKKEKIEYIIYQVIFLIYLIILFYIISKPEYSYQMMNLKPFKEILRYPLSSKLFVKNILGNILLFLPYGLFITFYFKIKKMFLIFILTFFLSLTIEIIQINIGRVFDIDDIFLNLLGGISGYSIAKRLDKNN